MNGAENSVALYTLKIQISQNNNCIQSHLWTRKTINLFITSYRCKIRNIVHRIVLYIIILTHITSILRNTWSVTKLTRMVFHGFFSIKTYITA